MAEMACVKRLQKEYRALCKEPVSHVVARPSPNDILEWHYVLEGSEGTPFAGGFYYGKIKFPPEYPFKPPGIRSPRELEPYVVCVKMDTSPTAGSVTTTVAEKQKLAKASLAFNCKNPIFRKLFPEYVEKYEEQQLLVYPVQEQVSSMPIQAKTSTPLLDDLNRVEPHKDMNNQRRTSLPTWLLLLLVSIFGVVMALPLLQL
ncbi:putative ubiquitin-conjugating enzyme E2 33 [Capsicum baccatum]|uniref:Ubiquitin-conjugating enzyme E2 33 n=1 Tax=Capsicum baccatum TaxID=33114 RepID=A0A2G2WKN2_CAPBA|nr:putative ubiquitin-conjugating enzyme E2 33 [Capsicum baccatum]